MGFFKELLMVIYHSKLKLHIPKSCSRLVSPSNAWIRNLYATQQYWMWKNENELEWRLQRTVSLFPSGSSFLCICMSVRFVCSQCGRRGVMNKNRLSFEPDDLQNNEATVLEQIYSLITCRRLLYACALFLRFLQQPAPHPNVLPIRPWPGAFSILMEKGPSNRFGLWLVCDRRPCSVLTYCQWHYIYVHISVHTINVCSFLHYLNRKTLAVDRWT